MPYIANKQWSFQELTTANTASELQRMSNNLSDLLGRVGAINGVGRAEETDKKLTFVHGGKWLFYLNPDEKTQAKIVPYATSLGDAVTLSDVSDVGGGIITLADDVPWLAAGMIYHVENVLFAVELERL